MNCFIFIGSQGRSDVEFEPKAKGEDREAGSTEFSVRKITGDRHWVRTASVVCEAGSAIALRRAREIFHQKIFVRWFQATRTV